MKKAIVTGANGHVGANLVRFLIDQGYRVKALVYKYPMKKPVLN